MKKEAVAADAWMKEVAPSTELRKWFGHQVERWDEFRRRYRIELNASPSAWEPILDASGRGTVTLLYSAHDVLHNGAVVLRDYLMERQAKQLQRLSSPEAEASNRSPMLRTGTRGTRARRSSLFS
jgi:uncharacterized protein YeaO (DUF488 family)